MALETFTVIGAFRAIVGRPSIELDPSPFSQVVNALAWFIPSAGEVRSEVDKTTYYLTPFLARIDNGVLKYQNGMPLDENVPQEEAGEPADPLRYGIRLAANTAVLDLPQLDYLVRFDRAVFNRRDQKMTNFQFTAPRQADEVVDLSTIDRRVITAGKTRWP